MNESVEAHHKTSWLGSKAWPHITSKDTGELSWRIGSLSLSGAEGLGTTRKAKATTATSILKPYCGFPTYSWLCEFRPSVTNVLQTDTFRQNT